MTPPSQACGRGPIGGDCACAGKFCSFATTIDSATTKPSKLRALLTDYWGMMEEDLTSLRAENEHLNSEVESLRSQLDEAKQNASVSAECGLKLMELNQELEQRLEQTTSEFTEQIQVTDTGNRV